MLGLGSALTASSTKEQLYSLSLDGTGDYLSLSDLITTGNNMSFSAWINRAATGNMAILSKHDGSGANILVIGFYDSNKFHVRVRAGTHSATTYTTLNEWKHVVITLAESGGDTTAKVYLDGDLSWTQDLGTNVMGTTTGKPWSIGQEWDGSNTSDHFNGKIDDVAMWNVTLDDDAVAAVYNSGKPFNLNNDRGNYDNASALQGYWRMGNGLFDDKENGVVHDAHNPGFADAANYLTTSWSGPTGGWSTTTGGIVNSGTNGDIRQNLEFSDYIGYVYKLEYTLSSVTDSTILNAKFGGGSNQTITGTAGNHIHYLTNDATVDNFQFASGGSWAGTITNISLRRLNGYPGLTAADATFSANTPDD